MACDGHLREFAVVDQVGTMPMYQRTERKAVFEAVI